jgi:hypothetical protein
MRAVELRLPPEAMAELDLSTEGLRGGDEIIVAINAIGTVSGLITIASLRDKLPTLARWIRSWRWEHPEEEPVLNIKAPGVDVVLPLPPNVGVQTIIDAMAQALDDAADRPDSE